MIPQVQDDLRQDFTFSVLPSRTFKMNHDTKTITGTIDQVRAVEQAVFLILNVERYEWLIYSWNYGFEKKRLIGKPVDYCIPEIERGIKEALLQDDRITAVDNFQFEVNKKKVLTQKLEGDYGREINIARATQAALSLLLNLIRENENNE